MRWTQALIKGLGAMLHQCQEDERLHPISYASQALSKVEENYTITKLEMSNLCDMRVPWWLLREKRSSMDALKWAEAIPPDAAESSSRLSFFKGGSDVTVLVCCG